MVAPLPVLASLEAFERAVVHLLNCELSSPFWNEVLPRVQKKEIAVPVFLGVLIVASFWRRRRALRACLTALAAWGLCMGLATLLWAIVERPRPWRVYDPILRTPAEIATCSARPDALVGRGHLSRRPSFPSRHALSAGVFAASAWGLARGLGAVSALLALLVAVGRVWKGVHWPSDVAVGLLVGALVAWGVWRTLPAVLDRIGKRRWIVDPAPDGRCGPGESGADAGAG